MINTKKRINISVSKPLEKAVSWLAKRDEVPVASKAAELITLALEIEEDTVWDSLASKRDVASAKFVSHKKAWA